MSSYRRTFLSHAHADNAQCERIAAALRARGIDCWLDLDNAQKGHALSEDIEHQLDTRSAFLLMVTASSIASHWVALELNNYTALWAEQSTHLLDGQERMILPVRLEDVPIPTRVGGFNWIDAAHQPFEQTVDQIARALVLAANPAQHATHPTPLAARLAALGFAARRINGIEVILPPLCDVPAGDFLMGSDPHEDTQAQSDEQPQLLIPLSYAYHITRFAATAAEYACFVRSGHTEPSSPFNTLTWEQQLRAYDHPVVNVSWFDADAYATWLTKNTGQTWRLPTEAEWEKAARWDPAARHSRIYPWGDNFDVARCNSFDSGIRTCTPVGSYPSGASPCGAQDMAGNIWEWTSSTFQPYRYQPLNDTERVGSTEDRVLRGGSWYASPDHVRAAYRGPVKPSTTGAGYGFRLVLAYAATSS